MEKVIGATLQVHPSQVKHEAHHPLICVAVFPFLGSCERKFPELVGRIN